MPFCYYVVHWKVNCLKLAVKPKLPEFQLIRKKYIKRKAKQLNGTKGGVSIYMFINNEEKEFTMKITTFLPWISFQSANDFHAGVRRGLFQGTIPLVYHILLVWFFMKPVWNFIILVWSPYYGPTVHDVSYPSAWNTELCIFRTKCVLIVYDASFLSGMIL